MSERAICVICGRGFDPFHNPQHMPSQPGRVAAYWNNRPKTFKEILKGDTQEHAKRKGNEKRQRGFDFI